ncbi:Rieske 2Fe-2S domain-containing protein [Corynebacterium incognita]|uniref:Rieske 2Fe-2S domain-containing protein n=2 Tax=Corynebacterium incognita TaxID=2754725 RepID=A0A7G7CSH1_9CORY|nr:Rieske 2Fe-2S domain-containing protein [Corynebacterium incognita]
MFLLGSATTLAGAYLAACGKEASASIAKTEIPVGSAVIIDKIIFAQPTEGEFKAYSQTCPHQGSLITEIEGDVATCTSHYTSYKLSDGSVIEGPGTKPLETFELRDAGDNVEV